ncbi:MAG: tetratricopeptide repeat protein [Treponema sp.]|nr:tetratricopeptide repeat protein [Treponema sp.]
MKKNFFLFLLIFLLSNFFFFSCSSQPKNIRGEINILRTQVETGLVAANREAAMGRFENALTLLTQHKNTAILTDDPSLIIRVCLSKGNILYSLEKYDDAYKEWDFAVKEAIRIKNTELLSVAKIYEARGRLLLIRASAETTIEIQSILNEVRQLRPNIKKDKLYEAFAWQVEGMTLRSLRRWNEAEDAIKKSLAIHQKIRYFENASYDWFVIASIRSLSGEFANAIIALNNSIDFDRRIENSWGLAASWRAMGDVYVRAGNSAEARSAYERSRAIYVLMRHDREVEEIDNKIRNL